MQTARYASGGFILKAPFRHLKKGVQQSIFWTIAYFILLTIFSGSGDWQTIDYLYTAIFQITLMLAVAVNSWVILPRFLNRKKYLYFFMLTIINIAAFTLFNHILFDQLIDYVLPGYYFISYYSYLDLLKFFFAFVVLTTLFHLSFEWFHLQESRHKLVLVEKEKIDAELNALTNQVNPHFLFNSLTVLYSLSLKDSRETSRAIIQLSDILRYVIYESATGKVPLKSEIALINNYISLQRYRSHPSTRVDFGADVQDDEIQIMPMLFLPLVENSFKHGVQGEIENSFVTIRLQSTDKLINLRIVNNRRITAPVENPMKGIGLNNIRSRLQLMYPNRHTFIVTETATEFQIDMELIVSP